jgi:hypothetical protein
MQPLTGWFRASLAALAHCGRTLPSPGAATRRAAVAAGLAFAVAAAGDPAQAAEIRIAPGGESPIRHVTVSGAIRQEDVRVFKDNTWRARSAVVELASVGGDPMAALEIARIVYARGFETVVPADAECAGACVIVWLAGSTRSVHRRGFLRYHITGTRDARREDTLSRFDLVPLERVLHADFGHTMNAVWAFTRTPPANGRDLTPELARFLDLEVVWLSGPSPDHALKAKALARPASTLTARSEEASGIPQRLVVDLMDWIRLNKPMTEGIVRHFYAESILYGGETLTRADLVARKNAYHRREPGYRVVLTSTPEVSCRWDAMRCTVEANANVHGHRDAHGNIADATLRYRFVVEKQGGRYRIVEERRDVLGADLRAPEPDRRALVARIQGELMRLGCRPGPADGVWGERTAGALARFHKARGSRQWVDGPTRHDLDRMKATPAPIC